MASSRNPKQERVAPHASILIESMRDIGYSLQTAVADVIDNSITAKARKIDLLAETDSADPAIGLLDDGTGMSRNELLEAMRPGSRSPLDTRPENDLGRFGLGLKTASFSQCRRMTVLTRSAGVISCAIWDLDLVAEADDWIVEFPESTEGVPWVEKLGPSGTLVVWQKLDRLVDAKGSGERSNLKRQIAEMARHLELVFHRFLTGESGLKKISMTLNNRPLVPFDPFHSKHAATMFGPVDKFMLGEQQIDIQPVTLPHHKKVTAEEWTRYAGPEGYLKNQGFYVYRGKRLIIHGTWFGLARQTELTKLSRVRIDMPNGMDAQWKIDVKKASAQPPPLVRERLRRIIEVVGASSRRVYTARGTRLVIDSRLPVWTRMQDKNQISYGLNPAHPAFEEFSTGLSDAQRREFLKILELAASTIPIDSLFADVSSTPESVGARQLDEDIFSEVVRSTFATLLKTGTDEEEVLLMMSSAEPFRSKWDLAQEIIVSLKEGVN